MSATTPSNMRTARCGLLAMLLFLCTISTARTSGGDADLPAGWRLPTDKESSDPAREDSRSRYTEVRADFNGDGVEDLGRMLKTRTGGSEALWVRLSQARQGPAWIKLDEIPRSERGSADLIMAIDAVKPGLIAYACFDTAPDCNFGADAQRPKLRLTDASLLYFRPESAASLFFWSNKHRKFMRVWLSD